MQARTFVAFAAGVAVSAAAVILSRWSLPSVDAKTAPSAAGGPFVRMTASNMWSRKFPESETSSSPSSGPN